MLLYRRVDYVFLLQFYHTFTKLSFAIVTTHKVYMELKKKLIFPTSNFSMICCSLMHPYAFHLSFNKLHRNNNVTFLNNEFLKGLSCSCSMISKACGNQTLESPYSLNCYTKILLIFSNVPYQFYYYFESIYIYSKN